MNKNLSESSPIRLESIEEIFIEDYCDESNDNSSRYSEPGTSPIEPLDTIVTPTKRLALSEESLVKAIEAINERGYSFYKASVEFGIPRSTLFRQWKTKKLTKNKIGRKPVLTPEQEVFFIRRIRRIVDTNYPVTPDYFCHCVYKFCEENHIKCNFWKDKKIAERYWLEYFGGRYPEIVKMIKKNPSKSTNVSLLQAQEFCQNLQETMIKNDVTNKPYLIYNVECKTLNINLATGLANLRDNGTIEANQSDDEQVKIICAGNATGQVIPPMIIFKGEKVESKWCKDFPLGAISRATGNGNVTSDVFNSWLRHFQIHKSSAACLLIFNETTLRLDYNVIQLADLLGITLLCLPGNNCIHKIGPIYKGCFRAFDDQLVNEVDKFWKMLNVERDTFKVFTRQTFGKVLSSIWNKAMTIKNVKSGFAASGIYPFEPAVILKQFEDIPSSSSFLDF